MQQKLAESLKTVGVTVAEVAEVVVVGDDKAASITEIFRYRPFPYDVFPSELKNLIKKMADAYHVQPEPVAVVMLTILSAAIGNSIRVEVKGGWKSPVTLWTMVIGRSGSGKSPFMNKLIEPILMKQAEASKRYKLETEQYEVELAEYTKTVKATKTPQISSIKPVKPELVHCYMTDTTVEALSQAMFTSPRGVLIHNDELSGFVKSLNQYKSNGADRERFLELWNCKPWKIDRVGRGSTYIKDTGCSIIGGIHPLALPGLFDFESFIVGFLPRFLMTSITETSYSFSMTEITEEDMKPWISIVHKCYDIPLNNANNEHNLHKILPMSPDAIELFSKYYELYKTKEKNLPEIGEVFISKLIDYCVRLSGILHVLNGGVNQIEKDTVLDAINLVNYFAHQTMQTLELYYYPNLRAKYSEMDMILIQTLYDLTTDVKNGRLRVKDITDKINDNLPDTIKKNSETISHMLRKLGLTTLTGSQGYSYLLWETEKLKKLYTFCKQSPTSPTTATYKNMEDTGK